MQIQLLPSHFTPCAVKPHKKLAHSSHQFKPLNVWTLNECDFVYLDSRGLSSGVGVRSKFSFLISDSISNIFPSCLLMIGLDLFEALKNDIMLVK